MLRDTPDAQIRVSQAEALVRSARLFLLDSLAQLWIKLLATGEVTMEARALARLAASHAVLRGANRARKPNYPYILDFHLHSAI
jgi:hypothetical protein